MPIGAFIVTKSPLARPSFGSVTKMMGHGNFRAVDQTQDDGIKEILREQIVVPGQTC